MYMHSMLGYPTLRSIRGLSTNFFLHLALFATLTTRYVFRSVFTFMSQMLVSQIRT
jgi:hypothetical protein